MFWSPLGIVHKPRMAHPWLGMGHWKFQGDTLRSLKSGLRLRATIHNNRAAGQVWGLQLAYYGQTLSVSLWDTRQQQKNKKDDKMSTDAEKQHVTLSEKSDHLSVLDAMHTQLFRLCKSMLLFTAGNSVNYLFIYLALSKRPQETNHFSLRCHFILHRRSNQWWFRFISTLKTPRCKSFILARLDQNKVPPAPDTQMMVWGLFKAVRAIIRSRVNTARSY